MPLNYRCPSCNTSHVGADSEAGTKVHCPTCGQRLQLPGTPLIATATATATAKSTLVSPTRVQVSAKILLWPQKCACCLGESETELQVIAPRLAAKKGKEENARIWGVPYCIACLAHVENQTSERVAKECCSSGPAVAHEGWRGTVHTFHFFNPGYARRFIEANKEKCLGLKQEPN